jgi:hypothetical protein
MDYKFAYKLPDGDGGERTVQADSDGQAVLRATAAIADFEDVNEMDVELKLIGKGDMKKGTYYECEGCT